jgi:hypothetical protein
MSKKIKMAGFTDKDMATDKVIQKYQQYSCEQLWQGKG